MLANRGILLAVTATFLATALAGCTTPGGGAELLIGTEFPNTGSLNKFGPIMTAGANAAATQVNNAGGAAGMKVRLIHEDDGTQPATGTAAAQKLKADGVSAVVGAAASGVSKAVYEVLGPARIVQISPSSTSPEFTTIMQNKSAPDRYFFRTSPSDALQGKVAGAYAISKNWTRVVMLYDNNPYGNGLRSTFTSAFQGVGGAGAPVRAVSAYAFEEGQTSYDSVLQTALTACTAAAAVGCPSGIFFAGYPTEAKQMQRDWWARTEWRSIPWLFSEGVQEQTFFDDLRALGITAVASYEGTAPVSGMGTYYDAYKALPGANTGLFGPHSFDAVMILSLAAQKANSKDGTAIRDAVRSVAGAPGEKVGPADYARAVQLLKEGKDIDYEGAAGSQNFDEFGDVTSAYEVYFIGSDGKLARKCLVPEESVTQTPVPLPAACGAKPSTTPPSPPTPPPSPPPGNQTGGNQTGGNATGPVALNITAKQAGCPGTATFCWDPANATVARGRNVSATMINPSGNTAHSLCFELPNSTRCTPNEVSGTPGGQNASVTFTAPSSAGSHAYYCAVPGHRTLGMEGTLTVT